MRWELCDNSERSQLSQSSHKFPTQESSDAAELIVSFDGVPLCTTTRCFSTRIFSSCDQRCCRLWEAIKVEMIINTFKEIKKILWWPPWLVHVNHVVGLLKKSSSNKLPDCKIQVMYTLLWLCSQGFFETNIWVLVWNLFTSCSETLARKSSKNPWLDISGYASLLILALMNDPSPAYRKKCPQNCWEFQSDWGDTFVSL